MNIVDVLQKKGYDKWETIGVIPELVVGDEEFLKLMAIESATQEKYYNTSAKRFAFVKDEENNFSHYHLNFKMKWRMGDVGDYERHRMTLRVVKVDADSESVEAGETPAIYPPYTLTATDQTMDKWINNMAVSPTLHLHRCLACVMRSQFGSSDRNSRDAFGLYCQDDIPEYEHWLEPAVRFLSMYPAQQAIDIVNFYVDMQQREITFSQAFGNFTA